MKKDTYSGCKLTIPNFPEKAPVRNGNKADPANPKLAIQPMDPVSNQGGKSFPVSFIKIGYIGPKKNPIMDTATALPINEGTNQTTSSSLECGEYS